MQMKTILSAILWGCWSATLPSCQQTRQQMPFTCSLHAIQHQHVGSLLHHWDTSLGRTISCICKEADIGGYKTNHFLRATAATRLYQSGVDEQLVMERTGHRSLEGVCSYKRTSDTQCQALSNMLNCSKKTPAMRSKVFPLFLPALASSTMQLDVSNTNAGTFYFHSCQSVTMNMHTSIK